MKAKVATALFLVCVALFLTSAGMVEASRFSQTVSAAEVERMTDEKMEALFRDKGETRRREVALVTVSPGAFLLYRPRLRYGSRRFAQSLSRAGIVGNGSAI